MMNGIVNPSEKYFKDGTWTFDGTVWRPQNQLLAYRDVVRLAWAINNATVGTNIYNFAAVPAGMVHVISSTLLLNAVTAASFVVAGIVSSAVLYITAHTQYVPVTRYYDSKSQIVIRAGENLVVYFYNCALNDILYAYFVGHSFMVAE